MSRSDKEEKQTLTRRDALRTFVTATGAIGLSILPKRWSTPIVEVGTLPAHAQISQAVGSLPTPLPTSLPPGFPPPRCIDIPGKVDVMVTQDTSGSISPTDLDSAKAALKLFVDQLNLSISQIGLVSFGSFATLEHQLSRDANAVKAAIDMICCGGGTDIAAGINESRLELLSSRRDPSNIPVIILLSDGRSFNPIPAADQAKADSILMITVGIGFGIDLDTMKAMATNADNDFYFTQTASELITMFDKNSELCQSG